MVTSITKFQSCALVLLTISCGVSHHWTALAICLTALAGSGGIYLRSRTGSKETTGQLQQFATGFHSIHEHALTLYGGSDSLRKIINEENQAVTQSSSALEEISAMLGKSATGAGKLAEMAASAKSSVELGQSAIGNLLKGLTVIDDGTNRLNSSLDKSLDKLNTVIEALAEIKSKTNLINEVVFQTKLLSFNASVEAARAGEHGKGFAVVAEEMGTLATNSGNASREIHDILQKNLVSTHEIVEAMKKELVALMSQARMDVAAGIESGKRGSEAFSAIVSEVDSVAILSGEISHATREQDIGVREITQAITQLQSTSDQLAAVADKTLKSALSLSEQTEMQSKDLQLLGNSLGIHLIIQSKPFDFGAAVSAHLDWKMKLSRYLNNPDHSLDPEKVCLDNTCALGKWIYGDGLKYQSGSTYPRLKSAHGRFHKTAAEIIRLINNQNQREAEKCLVPGGSYMNASDTCIDLIRQLQIEAAPNEQKASPDLRLAS